MVDHWKKLAEKLGTPGIGEPAPPTPPAPPAETPSANAGPEPSVAQAGSREEDVERGASDRPTEGEGPVGAPAGDAGSKPRVEVIKAVHPKPPTKRKEKWPRAKKKKRSTWDLLSSVLGVAPTEQPAAGPAPSPTGGSAPPQGGSSADRPPAESGTAGRPPEGKAQPAELFKPEPPPKNPALESMFADVPRRDLDEAKPNPRVIDDLGWDEPESEDIDDLAVFTEEFEEEVVIEETIEEREESREPHRRGRRRGRGRGRERREADVASPGADQIEPAGPFDEEESDEADDGIPLRRSHRRPPRRRQEARASDVAAPAEEEPSSDIDREAVGEEAQPPRRRRRRRSRDERSEDRVRQREESPSVRESARHLDRVDVDVEEEEEDAADSEGLNEGGTKHRNIPSWKDALEPIIAANMENHRRYESRGGGGRGRNRGRRS